MIQTRFYALWIMLCILALSLAPINNSDAAAKKRGKSQKTTEEEDPYLAAARSKPQAVEWTLHKSITEAFETKFPKEYKHNTYPLHFNPEKYAFSSEVVSSLDGSVDTKNEKSVLIKTVHTFGSELSLKDAEEILAKTAERYAASAESLAGYVVTNKDIDYNGFLGKELYIAYSGENDEKFGLRIRVFMTNYAKVELVLSGPSNTMYSYRADDFFTSLKLFDGIPTVSPPVPVGKGWKEYPSRNNIFTIKAPPTNRDFSPFPPEFSGSDKQGEMHYKLVDPVMEEGVYYNVYSYKTNRVLDYQAVKTLLFSNHIARFVENASPDSLNTQNTEIDGVNFMKTRLVISPPENLPHISTVFLEVRYKGDTAIIQELLTSTRHSRSDLNKTFFGQLEFHPEKYKPGANIQNTGAE